MSENACTVLRLFKINPGAGRESYAHFYDRAFDDPEIDEELETLLVESLDSEADEISVPEHILLALVLRDRKNLPHRPKKQELRKIHECEAVEAVTRYWSEGLEAGVHTKPAKDAAIEKALEEYSYLITTEKSREELENKLRGAPKPEKKPPPYLG